VADWRKFDATNTPGTCLWCGRKLIYRSVFDPTPGAVGKTPYSVPKKRPTRPGDYQDGFFCGLRCAYQFAVRLAELGSQLQHPTHKLRRPEPVADA